MGVLEESAANAKREVDWLKRSMDGIKSKTVTITVQVKTAHPDWTKGVPVPGNAAGGPVVGGQPTIVGEKGPELFIPSTSGQIIPNNKMGGGSSGGIVIKEQNFYISGGDPELTAEAVIEAMRAADNAGMSFAG
jgi:hypothetical protein